VDCGRERPATRLGTLDYMAPEVLRCPDKDANSVPGTQLYDGKVDSWAVGILAFEVLVGRAPFEQECKQTTCDLICYGDYQLPCFLSAPARDFITRALCKKASARPTIAEMLAHPWVSQEARRSLSLPSPTASHAPLDSPSRTRRLLPGKVSAAPLSTSPAQLSGPGTPAIRGR
jgi:aurora kinase